MIFKIFYVYLIVQLLKPITYNTKRVYLNLYFLKIIISDGNIPLCANGMTSFYELHIFTLDFFIQLTSRNNQLYFFNYVSKKRCNESLQPIF